MMRKTAILLLAALPGVFPCFAADSVRLDFSSARYRKNLPEEWVYKGKPFTPKPEFSIVRDPETGTEVLRIKSGKASGVILHEAENIVEKYPVMRWKWRMLKYPEGADGRKAETDDQAIALYVGFGRFGSSSVAYRWETETPKGESGTNSYSGGIVKVKWFAIRNKEDGVNQWYIEERNIRNDIRDTYGKVPDDLAVSVSSNSQYTGTDSLAELEYIEFVPENPEK